MDQDFLVEKIRRFLRPVVNVEAWAAVVILLKHDGKDFHILLVKRAVNPYDPWSGDMAFPGGKRRSMRESLWDTGVREAMEETGIDVSSHLFLGALETASSEIAPELEVLPFVMLCDEKPDVNLSDELSSYLWVSLENLRRSRGMAEVSIGEVPAYVIGGEVVWGLTYRMIENLIKVLDFAAGSRNGPS